MTVFNGLNKQERNLKILREEYEQDPENPRTLIYLADSIKSEGTEEARAEAEDLYLLALRSKRRVDTPIKQLAYDFLIPRLSGDGRSPAEVRNEEEALKLCDAAITDLPGMIDYHYYRAVLNNKKRNYIAARVDLEVCENAFTVGSSLPVTRVLLPSPMPLFYQQKVVAKGLGDEEGILKSRVVLNSMMAEAKSSKHADFIGSFIKSILIYGISEDEALAELAEVFDLGDPGDLMFIVRAAKDAGAIGFALKVMDMTKQIMNAK
jgi:tetratricopeptide (TPR) repeat protein